MWRFWMTVLCVCGLCGVWPQAARAEEKKAEKKVSLRPIDVVAPGEAVAEAKIRKALDERIDLEFTETELSNVAALLADKFKIDVQLDLKALEDASIGPDTPVTRHLKDVSLRSGLRMMLSALDLTYIIKNEVLLFTTNDRANNELRTKVYPVSDLTMPAPGRVSGEDFSSLIEVITTSTAPTTWDEVGGPASIQSLRKARSLVISQTDQAHEEILELLTALREARDSQPPAPQVTALESLIDSFWLSTHHPDGSRGRGGAMTGGAGGGMGGMGGGMGGAAGAGVGGGMF